EAKPAAKKEPEKPAEDVWGEASSSPGTVAAKSSEFSDAVAVQLPMQLPTGNRKPYFLLGDAGSPVDLWFVDLAKGRAAQFGGKGSGDVTPSDADDVTAQARYDKGCWSVLVKRALRPSSGVAFQPSQFVPIAFSVWDGHSRERGNKRALTLWFSLYVEPERVPSAAAPMAEASLGVFALQILIAVLVRRRRRP